MLTTCYRCLVFDVSGTGVCGFCSNELEYKVLELTGKIGIEITPYQYFSQVEKKSNDFNQLEITVSAQVHSARGWVRSQYLRDKGLKYWEITGEAMAASETEAAPIRSPDGWRNALQEILPRLADTSIPEWKRRDLAKEFAGWSPDELAKEAVRAWLIGSGWGKKNQ